MLKHFSVYFPSPAWAGGPCHDTEIARYWFLHRSPWDKPFGGRPRGRHCREDWGDKQRTRRGDIKFILLELLADGPSHGYDLIKEMENRYGQFRRLSPGSVYPTLQMLEEGGYLTSAKEGGKRIYTITDAGRELLAERSPAREANARSNPLDVPPEFGELRKAATELTEVIAHVARSGNTARMKQVSELLEQVKRDIYAILSEREN
ncbi:PadR family transcriptional regulator [Oscillatoria sp. FACHB-1406]|nr:PadR family transcriptional regulator [Oscillatoria sp. FACHB-1406]